MVIGCSDRGQDFNYNKPTNTSPLKTSNPIKTVDTIKPIETVKPEVNEKAENTTEESSKPSESFEYENFYNSKQETWQEAYTLFLRDFHALAEVNEFSLRDLDNNGIPELIIVQVEEEAANGVLTVYTYDGDIYKLGDYTDPKIGVAGLRFSNDEMYPGLFTLWWGGGVEHYGYLTVRDRKLVYEYLWYIDHTIDTQHNEISNDKQLINESINANPPYEYTDNVLKMYLINEDNISEISKWQGTDAE